MNETLGDRVRMHRARRHWSQSKLGEAIGLSTNGVSLIEKDKVDPRASLIRSLADALDVSTDYLLGRTKYWEEKSSHATDAA